MLIASLLCALLPLGPGEGVIWDECGGNSSRVHILKVDSVVTFLDQEATVPFSHDGAGPHLQCEEKSG